MASATDPEPPRRRRGRARRVAMGAGALFLVALLALWSVRRPIATSVIARELARRGVPARFTVADVGTGRQRLEHVILGDPRAPDLVADWIEAETHIGLDGASVTGVRAGGLRLRARWDGTRLTLGSLDRLRPASNGQPAALPALDLDVRDARLRLETPYGAIGAALRGAGRLDGGFRGSLALIAGRIAREGCSVEQPEAVLALTVDRGQPHVSGPIRMAGATCGGVAVGAASVRADTTIGRTLDRASGRLTLDALALAHPLAHAGRVAGAIDFAARPGNVDGNLNLTGQGVAMAQGVARSVTVQAGYRIAGGTVAFGGDGPGGFVTARGMALAPSILARAGSIGRAATGTPLAPLAASLARATQAAGRRFDLVARASGSVTRDDMELGLIEARATAASGARLHWHDGAELGWTAAHPELLTAHGRLDLSGGGWPTASVRLDQLAAGSPIIGRATMAPFAGTGARLALAPARFTIARDGSGRLATRVTLSGPLPGGSLDGLEAPLDVAWRRGALTLAGGCDTWRWQALALGGLRLGPARLPVCGTSGTLVRVAGGRVAGGATLGAVRLAGSLGASPLALDVAGGTFDLATRAFALRGVDARLGAPERPTRIAAATLDGTLGKGVGGSFAGGAGQIGAVPLLLQGAAGRWRFAGGALALDGALTIADAQTAAPRFHPLPATGVTLQLAGGRIDAAGRLAAPGVDRTVATVAITHDLASGRGHADLGVPGLVFDKTLQPDALTPITFGVVADVAGTIAGQGRIDWSADAVTSSGTFGTKGLDLAAAFGPVSGIAGSLRFTDLLGLTTAPGQTLAIKTINPGIPVTDGTVQLQLLGGARVRVEGAHWPFAGGRLALEPTTLDYTVPEAHRMTFTVSGVDARQFLAQFDFKNLDATGAFDGTLPIVFDANGGRIEGGRLAVRSGGGSLAYVGDLSQKDLGFWGNLAFQALKSLRYRSLAITMNGPLAGEMITQVHFAGVSQGQGARSNFIVRRLQRLPFVFNVTIKAPFRGLIDSAQSFYDPKRLIDRNLPALLREQQAPPPDVQPPASETRP